MDARSTLDLGHVGSRRKKLDSQEPSRDGTLVSLCITSHDLPPFFWSCMLSDALLSFSPKVSDALLSFSPKRHCTAGKTYDLEGHTLNNVPAF